MVPVEKNIGKAWEGPQGLGHQESHHLDETILDTCTCHICHVLPATNVPPFKNPD